MKKTGVVRKVFHFQNREGSKLANSIKPLYIYKTKVRAASRFVIHRKRMIKIIYKYSVMEYTTAFSKIKVHVQKL